MSTSLRLTWLSVKSASSWVSGSASPAVLVFEDIGAVEGPPLLLLGSLSISAFVFQAWWVIPPLAAVLLNWKVARSMEFVNRRDYFFAMLLWPAELYMWIRMGHFVRAWLKFFSRQQTDNWAAQAKAERGKGSSWLYPYLTLLVFLAASAAIWLQLPVDIRSDVLAVGWPILGIVTVLQTAWMFIKAGKRYRGFKA